MAGESPLVMIVNHDPEVVILLEQILEDLGCRSVLLANDDDWQTDGFDALVAYIDERMPDAVIFDLPPPYEASAEDLIRLIRASQLDEGQWVALSTGQAAVARVAAETEAVGLGKPFEIDRLDALLNDAFGRGRKTQGVRA